MISSIGAFTMAAGMLVFAANVIKTARSRAPGGQRPVARRHARVVHHLASAAMELRPHPLHHQRQAASRPAPAADPGGTAADGRALGAGARGWRAVGRRPRSRSSRAPTTGTPRTACSRRSRCRRSSALLVLAWVSTRRLLPAALAALGASSALAALLTGRDVHIAMAALAFGARPLLAARRRSAASEPGRRALRDYVTLTKPRVMSLLLLTGGAAIFVGAGGVPAWAVRRDDGRARARLRRCGDASTTTSTATSTS